MTLPRKLLMNLCASMLCLYLVFLFGIDASKSSNTLACQSVGALLHYFVLTTIFWMGVESRNMYVMLVNVLKEQHGGHFLLKSSCFAWGKFTKFPFIISYSHFKTKAALCFIPYRRLI